MTFQIPSHYDYIEDYRSAIWFQVDNSLLESLSSYGIDGAPFGGSGEVGFQSSSG